MARRILLSFLGNNHYQECCYSMADFKSKLVRFFPEALVQLLATNWTKQDQMCIFLTPAAEKNNWEGEFYQANGLKHALQSYPSLSINVQKNMPSGVSEAEIWQLFERLYACLQPNDEVYLDITHGFRSLPMLLMVLLDYAKALKNIQVKKIYYGAFEALGPAAKIPITYPNPADRIVPILDLTSFAALQDWTAAAADFKLYGKFHRLETLTQHSLAPMLQLKNGQAATTVNLEQINSMLKALVALLQTNRGKALRLFAFDELQGYLTQFSKSVHLISPLTAVIQEIQHKIAQFHTNDALFWLKAAQWCHQHGLIQQGITQLREGYITWLCGRFQKTINAAFFDFTAHKPRVLITNAFAIHYKKVPKPKWQKINKDHTPITRAIIKDPLIQQSAELFIQLGNLRNDINHGGYQHVLSADTFSLQLKKYITQLTTIIEGEATTLPKNQMKNGLINLSPFPAAEWSLTQRQTARQTYGAINDWDFPKIAPTLDSAAFDALVTDYYRKILAAQPKAVHIMGEMTFVFKLVERLKSVPITCICAVWNGRNPNDLYDGMANEFVQFREY